MNEEELILYNKSIKLIKENTQYIIDRIDKSINERIIDIDLDFKLYMNEYDMSIDDKIKILIKLRSKVIKMLECDKVKVRVATKWHPMCWAFNLLKKYPEKEFLNNFIVHGFCVPFYPSRPIMMAHYEFVEEACMFRTTLAHELTHSLMHTKDLEAKTPEDAINDAWTLCFMF
jgi:hypothetical protein